jgi:hypothetical protein
MLCQGRDRYGVEAFFASIRWDTGLGMAGEPFKMNDHYTAYYARFWLQNNRFHWGFFELRRVSGEYPQDRARSIRFDSAGQGLIF